jgi:hypothetical protein
MQQRRGTEAQWTSANPVLAAGEIGFEIDTNKFKIGDGINQWDDLSYFLDTSDLEGSFDDYIPLTQRAANNGVATLDAQGKIPLAQLGNVIDSAPEALNTLNELAAALDDDAAFATTVTNALANKAKVVSKTALQWSSDTSETPAGQISVASDTGKVKITTVAGATYAQTDFVASEDEVSAISGRVDTLETEFPTLQGLVETLQSDFNTIEGDVSTLQSDVTAVEGDVSSLQSDVNDKAPIDAPTFTGTVVLPSTTSIGDVSAAEIGYLSTVTSNVQDQIDAKLDSSAASTTYAPLAGPTFSGTVVLPSTTSIGDLSAAEIGYLSTVASNVQDQIDAKLASSTASTTYAPLAGPTFTGTVVLPSTTSIGTVDSTELGYLNDVTSNIQTQLNAKAPTADPTFTGTVSGITSAMVGLGSVDNTADADKPVSNATQTALDAKLSLSGGTMTGRVTLSADPTQALHAVTKQYVDGIESGLKAKPSVRAATTTNLSAIYDNGTDGVGATLTADSDRAFTALDGVTSWAITSPPMGVLVKNQTNPEENGRYNLTTLGSASAPWVLTRCGLCDQASEIPGAYVFVQDGTVNEGTGWVQIVADPDTFEVGTDAITVTQFSGPGSVTAGNNISVSGTVISVVSDPTFADVITASSGVAFSDGTQTKQGVPSITTISAKTDSYTLSNLNERDTIVEISKASAVTLTIPLNATIAYPVGTTIDIIQTGTGQVTIAGAGGVTVNATPGLKLRTQWSSATLLKRAENTWLVYGDLTA